MANSSCRASSTKPFSTCRWTSGSRTTPFCQPFLPSFKLRLDEAKHLPGWLQKGPGSQAGQFAEK